MAVTKEEVKTIIFNTSWKGNYSPILKLLHSCGLQMDEFLRVRAKDIAFGCDKVCIWDSKSQKK